MLSSEHQNCRIFTQTEQHPKREQGKKTENKRNGDRGGHKLAPSSESLGKRTTAFTHPIQCILCSRALKISPVLNFAQSFAERRSAGKQNTCSVSSRTPLRRYRGNFSSPILLRNILVYAIFGRIWWGQTRQCTKGTKCVYNLEESVRRV